MDKEQKKAHPESVSIECVVTEFIEFDLLLQHEILAEVNQEQSTMQRLDRSGGRDAGGALTQVRQRLKPRYSVPLTWRNQRTSSEG